MIEKDDSASPVPYRSLREVIRWHGLIVPVLGLLLRWIRIFLPLQLLFRLGHCRLCRRWTCDSSTGKLEPWCQDFAVLLIAATVAGIICYASAKPVPPTWCVVAAVLLLASNAIYHAGVLWFDDLKPGRTWEEASVFSHRRVLFQAFFSFAESVFLFALLHRHLWAGASDVNPSELYGASFEVASTLSPSSLAESVPRWLINLQVCYSIFFLVVVISIVASVGYNRGELAPSE